MKATMLWGFRRGRTPLALILLTSSVFISVALSSGSSMEEWEFGAKRFIAESNRAFHRHLALALSRAANTDALHAEPNSLLAFLIQRQIGDSFFDAQDFQSAVRFQESAAMISDQHFGINSSESLTRLSKWAQTLYFLDRYQAAMPIAERALTLSESLFGLNSLETAERQSDLALIYSYADRDQEAVLLAHQALYTRIQLQGLLDEDTIEQLRILAEAGRNLPLGPERGARIDEIALALSAEKLGWNSVRTETLLNDIDWFYRQQGDCMKSLPYAEESLALTLKLEGTETSEAANRYHSLGTNDYCIGNLGQAISNTEEALRISRKVFGSQHSRVAYLEAELADWHEQLGHVEQSRKMAHLAIDALDQSMGDHHPNAPDVFDFVATAALHWDPAWSKALSLRYLHAMETDWGKDDIAMVDPLINLANAEMILGDLPQGLRHARRAVELTLGYSESRHLLPDEDALDALVLAENASGNDKPSERLALMALRYAELRSGLNHPYTSHAYQQLASAVRGRHPAIAVALLKRAIQLELQMLPNEKADHEGYAQTLTDLIVPHCQRLNEWLKEDGRLRQAPKPSDKEPCTVPPQLTPSETLWLEQYDEIARRRIALDGPTRRLKREKEHGSVTPRDLMLVTNLDERIEKQNLALNTLFNRPLVQTTMSDAQPGPKKIAAIQERLHNEPKGTAWIHFGFNAKRLVITLVTTDLAKTRVSDVDIGFLQQQRDRSSLTLDQLQSLYRLFIQPIKRTLDSEGIQQILIDSQSAFTDLPYAAFHDGDRYLAESFIILQLDGTQRVGTPFKRPTSIAAFGLSEAIAGFKALPSVKTELEHLTAMASERQIQMGVFMNTRFTNESLHEVIDRGNEAIHIATHFIPSTGREASSSLLLGNGRHLSGKAFAKALQRKNRVKLISLSACETRAARSDKLSLNQEDLMIHLVRSGVPYVLGTLWPVSDQDAVEFMSRFYEHLFQGKVSIQKAFQETQSAFSASKAPKAWSAFVLLER